MVPMNLQMVAVVRDIFSRGWIVLEWRQRCAGEAAS